MAKTSLDLFKCKKCLSAIVSKNSNYIYCTKLKDYIYEDNTFCEAEGILNPDVWYMKDPHLRNYLNLEKKFKINILPKHMDREYYKKG